MVDIDKLTKETISKGGLLAVLYFDMSAQSKDGLQQLGAALVQKILETPGVVYAMGEIEEPIENEGLFSCPVEVKVLTRSLASLAKICGNHAPFSVELKRPDEIKLTVDQAHDLLMGISLNNYELKKLILEKVYKGEQLLQFRKQVQNRMELSKKVLEG